MTRTSTRSERTAPRGRISRSCNTRNSFACSDGDSSAISSRKMVPPWASTKMPGRSAWASVKAPRLWPNSSLSSSASGMAAQLTATNGRSRRGLFQWIDFATSSLPVPDSPVTSTDAAEPASRRISANTSCMADDLPMMLSKR